LNSDTEKLEKFIEKSEIIANFLRQQVMQKRIHEALYVRQIEDFLAAFSDFKTER
jgi:hypothetical protein